MLKAGAHAVFERRRVAGRVQRKDKCDSTNTKMETLLWKNCISGQKLRKRLEGLGAGSGPVYMKLNRKWSATERPAGSQNLAMEASGPEAVQFI